MKPQKLWLLCVALLLTACSGKSTRLPMGDDRSLISEAQAQTLAQSFLVHNGVTNAELIGVRIGGEEWTGAFSMGGTNPPLGVLVNRKSKKVGYEHARP